MCHSADYYRGSKSHTRVIHCTYFSILHGSNVRSEAAICGGNDSLHAFLQLVQLHGEGGECIELQQR